MRSYYAHLENAASVAKSPIQAKPTFRSSAIFPMFNFPGITSRIVFMGYWILKRNIREIACVVSLRSEEGNVLHRNFFTIQEAKTFRLELKEYLASAGYSPESRFIGSLEVEFFSTVNLVFPFPAVVVNYYGEKFSSVVHTAQRIYNDFDDLRKNSQTDVAESGFNIYADDDHEPFFGMINGGESLEPFVVGMNFYNADRETLYHEINFGKMKAYETKVVYPAKLVDLKSFLKGKPGACKLNFHLNWVFPRLVVGNIQHSLPAITLTHTYYDCSNAKSESDYWLPSQPQWHLASLMLPVSIEGSHFTNVYFYPIYSPSIFNIDVEVYNSQGHLLGTKMKALTINSPMNECKIISFKSICRELGIEDEENLGARIIAKTAEGDRIPSRIKLGFDIGQESGKMPCNICTNLQPFNPSLDTKPRAFRWAPFLADQENATVWIMNSSPHVDYKREAEIELAFFREEDASTLTRKLTLPPHGFHVIHLSKDSELKTFFGNQIGWFTAISNNPYTTTYYFTENASGVVGGDHGF